MRSEPAVSGPNASSATAETPDWIGTTGGSPKVAAAKIATKATTPSCNSGHPSGRNSESSPTTLPIAVSISEDRGGRVDQEPALSVAAHGKRRLRSRQDVAVVGARLATRSRVRIPLREAATGGGSQDDSLQGERP
jgi:hypothetical protein